MALRRSNWTLNATRPPTKRRTWATANRNTPAATSRASHGASGRRRSRMTSSMITFWISGVKADTVRPSTATPKAVMTSARWAMRYGHSRRIQPRDIRREYGGSSGYGCVPGEITVRPYARPRCAGRRRGRRRSRRGRRWRRRSTGWPPAWPPWVSSRGTGRCGAGRTAPTSSCSCTPTAGSAWCRCRCPTGSPPARSGTCSPTAGRRWPWSTPAYAGLVPGAVTVADVVAAGVTAQTAGAGRRRGDDALHLRHHRAAQGRGAPAVGPGAHRRAHAGAGLRRRRGPPRHRAALPRRPPRLRPPDPPHAAAPWSCAGGSTPPSGSASWPSTG